MAAGNNEIALYEEATSIAGLSGLPEHHDYLGNLFRIFIYL